MKKYISAGTKKGIDLPSFKESIKYLFEVINEGLPRGEKIGINDVHVYKHTDKGIQYNAEVWYSSKYIEHYFTLYDIPTNCVVPKEYWVITKEDIIDKVRFLGLFNDTRKEDVINEVTSKINSLLDKYRGVLKYKVDYKQQHYSRDPADDYISFDLQPYDTDDSRFSIKDGNYYGYQLYDNEKGVKLGNLNSILLKIELLDYIKCGDCYVDYRKLIIKLKDNNIAVLSYIDDYEEGNAYFEIDKNELDEFKLHMNGILDNAVIDYIRLGTYKNKQIIIYYIYLRSDDNVGHKFEHEVNSNTSLEDIEKMIKNDENNLMKLRRLKLEDKSNLLYNSDGLGSLR